MYNGVPYLGCAQIDAIDSSSHICPTNLNGSITFDPSSHSYGHCTCASERSRRENYPHEELLRKVVPQKTYQVLEGDSWESISTKVNVQIDRLLRYNGLDKRHAGVPFCFEECTSPVPGTWIITDGLESVMPECKCQETGFPHISDNMLNCEDKRIAQTEFGSKGTARFCTAAHPAGFVTVEDDSFWEARLTQDAPADLFVDFQLLSEIIKVNLEFAMDIPPSAILDGVILALKDDMTGTYNDQMYFVQNCETTTFAADNGIQSISSKCYALGDDTVVNVASAPLGPSSVARLRFYAKTGGADVVSRLSSFPMKVKYAGFEGRTFCNGHASSSFLDDEGTQTCQCEHGTAGKSCEMCAPLLNNRPYLRAKDGEANECEACECNDHAESCSFSAEKGTGVCNMCMHNTGGDNCGRCQFTYYRNTSALLNDENVCVACDCNVNGTLVGQDAYCRPEATATTEAGQCTCKPGTTGIKCDQCKVNFWGLGEDEATGCASCGCDVAGAASAQCDSEDGTCECNEHYKGRDCSECAQGYTHRNILTDEPCVAGSTQCQCVKCNNEPLQPFFSDPETNVCSRCHEECYGGCDGPERHQCDECRNFGFTRPEDGDTYCVKDCFDLGPSMLSMDSGRGTYGLEVPGTSTTTTTAAGTNSSDLCNGKPDGPNCDDPLFDGMCDDPLYMADLHGMCPVMCNSCQPPAPRPVKTCEACSTLCDIQLPGNQRICSGDGEFDGDGGCHRCRYLSLPDKTCLEYGATCPAGHYANMVTMTCDACHHACNPELACSGPEGTKDSCDKCLISTDQGDLCSTSCSTGAWNFIANADEAGECKPCNIACAAEGCDSPDTIVDLRAEFGLASGSIADWDILQELTAATCVGTGSDRCADGYIFSEASVTIEGVSDIQNACVLACVGLSYEGENDDGLKTCKPCHRECKAGCSGPSADQCTASGQDGQDTCKTFMRTGTFECFETCPPAGTEKSWGIVPTIGLDVADECSECSAQCDGSATFGNETGKPFFDGISACTGPNPSECADCAYKKRNAEGDCVSECPANQAEDGTQPEGTTRDCIICKFRATNKDGACMPYCSEIENGVPTKINGVPHFVDTVTSGVNLCIACDDQCRNACDSKGPENCLPVEGSKAKCKEALDGEECVASCHATGKFPATVVGVDDYVCKDCPSECGPFTGENRCCLGEDHAIDATFSAESKTCGFVSDDSCTACDPACLGCTGPGTDFGATGHCDKCLHFEHEGKCVLECPNFYYGNELTKKCEQCAGACDPKFGCANGDHPSQCDRCRFARSETTGDCVFACSSAEVETVSTDITTTPLSPKVCAKCAGNGFVSKDNECVSCDDECRGGCTGPTFADCIDTTSGACANFRVIDANGSNKCVADCSGYPTHYPFKSTTTDKEGECRPCDAECANLECTGPGPSNCKGGQCAHYKMPATRSDQGSHTCVEKCPDYFYSTGLFGSTCKECHEQCRSCSGSRQSDCGMTDCANVWDDRMKCVTKCPLAKFAVTKYDEEVPYTVCEVCDEKCDSNFGCTGKGPSNCNKCLGVASDDGTCLDACEEGSVNVDGVCSTCDESCAFGCTGLTSADCSLPAAVPELGFAHVETTVLMYPLLSSVKVNGALRDAFRRSLGSLLDGGNQAVSVASAEVSTGGLSVTLRVTVPEDQVASATNRLHILLPSNGECESTADCLQTALQGYPNSETIFPSSGSQRWVLFRRSIVDAVMHTTRCADGYVENFGQLCSSSCIARTFLDARGYCQPCDGACAQCTGPDAEDCVGACLVPSLTGNGCAATCAPNQFVGEGRCLPCSNLCAPGLGCTGPGPDKCVACNGYKLDGICYSQCPGVVVRGVCVAECIGFRTVQGGCVETCPDNTIVDSNKVCQPCHEQCYSGCTVPGDATRCLLTAYVANEEVVEQRCKGAVVTVKGSSMTECVIKCAGGQYFRNVGEAPALGSGGGHECKPCEAGYRCVDGEVQDPCPLRTFSDAPGASECMECPANAVCAFNWEKGSRDSFQCLDGFTKDAVQYTCVDADAARAKDDDFTIMVGVVAGCIVLVVVIATIVCWQRQSLAKEVAGPSGVPGFASPGANMSMSSYPSGTFPVARDYVNPNISILSAGSAAYVANAGESRL